MARRPRGLLIFALIVVAAGAWLLVARLRGPEVPVVRPTRRAIVQRVVATGRVLPPARIELGSVVTGKVLEVAVDEGDAVTPGQLLVRLDDAQPRADRARADAAVDQALARLQQVRGVQFPVADQALRQARARLELARAELARATALHREGAATAQQLDEATSAVEVARAQAETAAVQAAAALPTGSDARAVAAALEVARADAARADAALEDRRLVAPVAGTILERAVEAGDVVQPGRALITMARAGGTRLEIEPEERNLATLAVGQKALASADAFPAETFEAVVASIAPAVDPLRGTIAVKLRVPAPPAYLRPDMTVSVNVDVARHEDALVVPATAVRDLAGAPWVLVVEDGHARRRPLRIGLSGEQSVEVLGGLAPDAALVPGGVDVAEGQRVRPRAAEPQR